MQLVHMLIDEKFQQNLYGTTGSYLDAPMCGNGNAHAVLTEIENRVTCLHCLGKMRTDSGSHLVNKVIEQIKMDVLGGDTKALETLLISSPVGHLISYLPKEE